MIESDARVIDCETAFFAGAAAFLAAGLVSVFTLGLVAVFVVVVAGLAAALLSDLASLTGPEAPCMLSARSWLLSLLALTYPLAV